MNSYRQEMLNEDVANIIENLACRIAERCSGALTPSHLMPYLPVSLNLVQACLDNMVDGAAVLSMQRDGVLEYQFPAYRQTEPKAGALKVNACVSCGSETLSPQCPVLCERCFQSLQSELTRLAEQTGWAAQAIYEHELLYLAAKQNEPVRAETLAGQSRFTLRSMRERLKRLDAEGYVNERLEEQAGTVVYGFPRIDYPKEFFDRNRAIVSSYPDSVTEEVQVKVVRVLFALGAFILGLIGLAFLHVPFILLLFLFAIGTPVLSLLIWRRRSPIEEE